MSYEKSQNFNLEKKIFYNEGIYYLIIKVPQTIKSVEYKILGSLGFQSIGENTLTTINKKEDNIILTFMIKEVQELFIQLTVYENLDKDKDKYINLHHFIDMNFILKEQSPNGFTCENKSELIDNKNINIKKNINMEINKKIKSYQIKSSSNNNINEKEEEESDESEDDESDENQSLEDDESEEDEDEENNKK